MNTTTVLSGSPYCPDEPYSHLLSSSLPCFKGIIGPQFKAAFHSLKQCTKLEYDGFALWRNDQEEQLDRPAMMLFITHP